jgi:hypothetical protein
METDVIDEQGEYLIADGWAVAVLDGGLAVAAPTPPEPAPEPEPPTPPSDEPEAAPAVQPRARRKAA